MGRLKKKDTFVTEISEGGSWVKNPNEQWLQNVLRKFKGEKVRLSCEVYQAPKSSAQLGYFFGVVLPYYVYGLIQSGTDIELGNEADEKMVEDELKRRHLKNGIPWKAKKVVDIIGPKYGDEIVVKSAAVDGYVRKGDLLFQFGREGKDDLSWMSKYDGEFKSVVSAGDIIGKEEHVGSVVTIVEIPGPPSLQRASWIEAKRFVDSVKKEASEFFGFVIPDPDPEYQRGGPSLRDQLREKLKGVRIVKCGKCGGKTELTDSQMEGDYVLCVKCMI